MAWKKEYDNKHSCEQGVRKGLNQEVKLPV